MSTALQRTGLPSAGTPNVAPVAHPRCPERDEPVESVYLVRLFQLCGI